MEFQTPLFAQASPMMKILSLPAVSAILECKHIAASSTVQFDYTSWSIM
jgi:hypothetical protein